MWNGWHRRVLGSDRALCIVGQQTGPKLYSAENSFRYPRQAGIWIRAAAALLEISVTRRCRGPLSDVYRRTIFMILNNTLDYAYTSRALDQRLYQPGLTRSRRVVKVFSQEHQKKIEDYILKHPDAIPRLLCCLCFSACESEKTFHALGPVDRAISALIQGRECRRIQRISSEAENLSGENGERHAQLLVTLSQKRRVAASAPDPGLPSGISEAFSARRKRPALSADQRYGAPDGGPATLQYHIQKDAGTDWLALSEFSLFRHPPFHRMRNPRAGYEQMLSVRFWEILIHNFSLNYFLLRLIYSVDE